MDRLTRRTDLGATFGRYSYLSDLELKRAAEQLAAYEDTGLTPEEIERLKKSDASKEQSSINYYSEAKQLRSEVAALKAENERLRKQLSPKALYGIHKGKVEEFTDVMIEYHFLGKRNRHKQGMWAEYPQDFGKTVFFTCEEAQARLGEGIND